MTKHGLNLKCTVDDCGQPRHAKGLCPKHYARLRFHGSIDKQTYTWDAEKYFWPKVHKTETCWEWRGYARQAGYGTVSVHGRDRPAHVVSYVLTKGPVPEGLILDHICRNRSCVRPSHLRPVTFKQNGENRKGSSMTPLPRGVGYQKKTGKFRARVIHHRQTHYVGQYDTAEEAAAAALAKRNELYTHNDSDRITA